MNPFQLRSPPCAGCVRNHQFSIWKALRAARINQNGRILLASSLRTRENLIWPALQQVNYDRILDVADGMI